MCLPVEVGCDTNPNAARWDCVGAAHCGPHGERKGCLTRNTFSGIARNSELMNRWRWGEANLGALIGVVIGGMGGLVAITIPLAILRGDIKALSEARTLGLLGFLVSGATGWFLGGQLGARLQPLLGERPAHIIGGVAGGLIPIGALALWGWYLVRP